ncbi:hypothetical protein DBR11_03365 [Pedobacter sp. HMWF019]|uniref:tellurite resistance TerB C-terminal domain-containing protein n=1 Tax=Pedobacter sp. HMWF019 TaxID=2056856 RepID=UPI000D3D2140|nr:tellurite resistance TerB C-terminal domain-containing protein [Pedobacter sp. HMWF019]PTT03052.1 hypothetical protein DBR11_03365 [Pedobacter sp. HMWF019]
MIGALLMLFCLAIVFLTRPNQQQNNSIKKFTSNVRRYFNMHWSPISEQIDTTPALRNRSEDQIMPPLQFTTNSVPKSSSSITEAQITDQPKKTGTNNLDDLNQKKVEILQSLKESLLRTTFKTEDNKMDNSIIDIDAQPEPINYSDTQQTESLKAPNWPHMYVYGYSDLEGASEEQRAFYDKFKVKFLTNKWVDLSGNSNYVFILLFDLLKQFNVHKNITLLEEQMNQISTYYPKTRPYAKKFLIQKMREVDYQEGLDRLEWTTANNVVPDYQTWDWKSRSIKKLNLSNEDGKLLDDMYFNQNNFIAIEFCSLEVLKLYITARKALKTAYAAHNIKQEDQFAIILDLIARKQYNYRLNSQNYRYVLNHSSQVITGYIFKYCENKIRGLYDYKKLNLLQSYHEEVLLSLTTNVASFIEKDINEHLNKVNKPDQETERYLNAQVTTRWKTKLNLTTEYYKQLGKHPFLAEVNKILDQNSKNPSLEIIYYEVFKFLAPLDKQLSFEYYLRYINQHLTGSTLVLKLMPQNIVKKLFTTPELHTRYTKISIALMKKEINIDTALEEVKDFFLPQRKKILLDTAAIKQVEQQHSGTVEVLNEYLKDQEEPKVPNSPPPAIENNSESQPFNFTASPNEQALLHLFKQNNFTLSNNEVDLFCKNTGAHKGTLINNLNESCYDIIDDLLIENDDSNYTINHTYYQQILKA